VLTLGGALLATTPDSALAQIPTVLTSDATVNSVACPAAGACVAVGSYQAVGGEPAGLLLTQTAGVWSQSIAAELPAGSNTNPEVNLASASCATVGNCAAVGNYVDSGYLQQGVLLNFRKGVWRPGVRVIPPAGAGSNPEFTLNAVSCAAAGDCTAVGSYTNSVGNPVAFAVSEINWSWGAVQSLPLPAGAGSSSAAAVSCAAIGGCTAVGWYSDSSGAIQGLLATETGGGWGSSFEAALPAAAAVQPNVTLNSVACTGAGYCTAVGQYTDSNRTFQGVVLTENAGSWQTGVEAVLPAAAASNQDVTLDSVACVAYETCVIAGDYFSSAPTGLILSETSGRWKPALKVRLPAGAGSNPYAALNSVACAPGMYCSVGGDYVDNGGNGQGVLLDGNGLYWPEGLEGPLPGGLTTALKRHQQVRRHEPAVARSRTQAGAPAAVRRSELR